MKEYIFKAPLWYRLSKSSTGKKYHLNLNNYHNWHFSTRNNLKIRYQLDMKEQLEGYCFGSQIDLKMKLIRGDNRRVDRANVLCLHEKFFCDAMVQHGCIEDDSDKFIRSSYYCSGEVNKEDPHVEIRVLVIDQNLGED